MNTQRGSSLLEVILAIALSLALVPFMYNQISDMNNAVKNVAIANKIVKSKGDVINYVRENQALFPIGNTGTVLDEDKLALLAPMAHTGWVFKTENHGSEMVEIFLAYTLDSNYQAANIAKYIGNDAAIVSNDNVAYSQNWAIGGDGDVKFNSGDLIFRITKSLGNDNKSKFLHRGTFGEDALNVMQRDLHLNTFDIYNVADIRGEYIEAHDATTKILSAGLVESGVISFMGGANIIQATARDNMLAVRKLYVSNNLAGFTNINVADVESHGNMIAKRVNVTDIVDVAGNLMLNAGGAFNFVTIGVNMDVYADSVNVDNLSATKVLVSNDIDCSKDDCSKGDYTRLEIGNWKYPNPQKNTKTAPNVNKDYLYIDRHNLATYFGSELGSAGTAKTRYNLVLENWL
ncbi:MAG: hypothetical protein J6S57_02725 [Alphaproteobacteria bacterium]|nr:hypothetical protein [Alphaproteobacteria bacterium]